MPLRAISLCLVLTAVFCGIAEARDRTMWELYKRSFLSDDGRIIDHAQDQISHSEGQGYGMLLATIHRDRAAFDRIWTWTKNNLQVRSDGLFAWQWGKRPDNAWKVLDSNNATDGDILIAFALLKASDAWHSPDYREEARKIIASIRSVLAVTRYGRTYLLPGAFGFTDGNSVVLNPSYLIFPAYRAFARADQPDFWEAVRNDGLFLIKGASFGSLGLPANWVVLENDRIALAPGKDPYFGADAVRVLLMLGSEDRSRYPKGVSALLEHYQKSGRLPLWIDLEKDSESLKLAYAGYYAIYAAAARKLGKKALAERLLKEARKRLKTEKDAYYSFSLYLLATGGWENRAR
ncbi:MAG: glycosyl hydrolase family 8 [Nitrospirota bacterium]|nr:glycosyl hydrolase family 8 [Nitrospirota bacterium]